MRAATKLCSCKGGGVVLANNHVNEEINEVFGL
jgi:hypothetical protein